MIYVFLKGLFLGLSIAAPVGPIGLLCINRSIVNGRKSGMASGLGAALGDGTYAILATFGITIITTVLFNYVKYIRMIGVIFLIFLAYELMIKKSPTSIENSKKNSLMNYFISTYLLTLVNPLTIISFIAIFAGAGIVIDTGSWYLSFVLVLGVFLGSLSWFTGLAYVIGGIRHYLNPKTLSIINKLSALVLLSFAIWTTYEILK